MAGTPASAGRIVVATSFPPQLVRMNAGRRMEDYDRLCVQSWIACGFKIIALNAPDEIPALASRYPEVEFIPTQRNAGALFGRKTPFVADILSALHRESASVLGIMNSDVLFEPAAAWRDLEQLVAHKSVVTGQRCDTKSLSGGVLHRYYPGFDYFFFDHAAAQVLVSDTRPFAMGLPWWDYWLPIILGLKGYDIRCLARPTVLHLAHEMPSTTRSAPWRRLGVAFARAVMCESESSHTPSPQWGGLFSHCRELAGTSDSAADSGERDQPIGHLAELAVPVIAGSIMELGDGASPLSAPAPLAVSAFFDEIPKRLAAGDALHRAMWHETRNELREAQHFYRVAVENAPRDAGVLYTCGNDCFRRGDLERAASLFRRAIELMPDSAILLNSLGSTLAELGRRDEAMAYFERALKIDPLYAPTYYNLVIGLYPRDAYRDIVRLLEQRVKDEPDFAEGGEWLIRIRETLSQLQTPVPGPSRHAPQ